jgi:hypothetical protein
MHVVQHHAVLPGCVAHHCSARQVWPCLIFGLLAHLVRAHAGARVLLTLTFALDYATVLGTFEAFVTEMQAELAAAARVPLSGVATLAVSPGSVVVSVMVSFWAALGAHHSDAAAFAQAASLRPAELTGLSFTHRYASPRECTAELRYITAGAP